eukprot:8750022-Pyramimonas_sp.AAC.1
MAEIEDAGWDSRYTKCRRAAVIYRGAWRHLVLDSLSGERWVAVIFRYLLFVSVYLSHRGTCEPRGNAEGHYA